MDERAETLEQVIDCPICPGQNLAEAQVELAEQMRQIIRDKLAEGQTDQEIIQFFKEIYGSDVHLPTRAFRNTVEYLATIMYQVSIGELDSYEYAGQLYDLYTSEHREPCPKAQFVQSQGDPDNDGWMLPWDGSITIAEKNVLFTDLSRVIRLEMRVEGGSASVALDEGLRAAYPLLNQQWLLEEGNWRLDPEFDICGTVLPDM